MKFARTFRRFPLTVPFSVLVTLRLTNRVSCRLVFGVNPVILMIPFGRRLIVSSLVLKVGGVIPGAITLLSLLTGRRTFRRRTGNGIGWF